MQNANLNRQQGFTLIELLVACAILLILGALAMTSFTLYKEKAFLRTAEQMMHNARTALEAGKMNSESLPAEVLMVDQSTAGPMVEDTAKLLMPGMVLSNQLRLFATYDPTCNDPACLEDYIQTRHCMTKKKVVYFRTHGGIEATTFDVDDPADCP